MMNARHALRLRLGGGALLGARTLIVRGAWNKKKAKKKRPYVLKGLVEQFRPMVEKGLVRKPAWFDGMVRAPPPVKFRGDRPRELRLPEHELEAAVLRKHPLLRYEDRDPKYRPFRIAVRFALRQLQLSQKETAGDVEQAGRIAEREFAEEIAQFEASLRNAEDPAVVADRVKEHMEQRTLRLRAGERPERPSITEQFNVVAEREAARYKGDPLLLFMRAFDKEEIPPVATVLRDVLRMTVREREETHLLVERELEPRLELLDALLEDEEQAFKDVAVLSAVFGDAFDFARLAERAEALELLRFLLDVPLQVPTETSDFEVFEADFAAEVDAISGKYAALDSGLLSVEQPELDVVDAPSDVAGAEADDDSTVVVDVDQDPRLGDLAELVRAVQQADEEVVRVRAAMAEGRPLDADLQKEAFALGYTLEGEPVFVGDRSFETPAVPRSERLKVVRDYSVLDRFEDGDLSAEDIAVENLRSKEAFADWDEEELYAEARREMSDSMAKRSQFNLGYFVDYLQRAQDAQDARRARSASLQAAAEKAAAEAVSR